MHSIEFEETNEDPNLFLIDVDNVISVSNNKVLIVSKSWISSKFCDGWGKGIKMITDPAILLS